MTDELPDDGFHEIQLSGKQLVFLFMATTVVSVVIFLCGVLVGRNVDTTSATVAAAAADASLTTPARRPAAAVEQPSAQAVATPAEPPSPPAGDELTYRKRLESELSPAAERLKTSAAVVPADERAAPAKLDGAKPESAKPAPAGATGSKPAAVTATAQGGRPGRWVVQLVALRDRSAASSIVQRLAGKGYPAFILNPSAAGSGQVYRVQVGRYDDRNEAERVSRRLEKEEKFTPWISR